MKRFASVRSTTVMAIITLICIMIVPVGAAFQDVPKDNWAANYVAYAEAYGLINGIGDGKFAPNATLTEAQCCQIVYNTLVAPTTRSTGVRWYSEAVNWVQARLKGHTIDPDRAATRAFVCQLVMNFHKEAPAVTADAVPRVYTVPADCSRLTDEQKLAIGFCYDKGIINGYPDGTFKPKQKLTRAEGAKVFALWHQRYYDAYGIDPAQPMSVKQLAAAEAGTMGKYAATLGWKVETAPWPYNHDDGTYWYQLEANNQNGTFEFLVGGSISGTDTWWYQVTKTGFEELSKESVKASFTKWA